VSGHIRALEWFGTSAEVNTAVSRHVRCWNDADNSLKLMEWCLGISEHWNGSEHLLKLIVWCLGMSEHRNGSEHLLKLIQQCLNMLDIGMMQMIYRS
jgi:hypothetical protein